MMRLYINPFLNKFYEWGKGNYWDDKLDFIKYLDSGWPATPMADWEKNWLPLWQNDLILPEELQEDKKMQEYLKRHTPKWYWKHGFGFTTGTLWENNYWEGAVLVELDVAQMILDAWNADSELPFRGVEDKFFTTEVILPILYEGYPEELGKAVYVGSDDYWGYENPTNAPDVFHKLKLYEYLVGAKQYPEEDDVYGTQLVEVEIHGIKRFLNAIYFTTKKNVSWCESSRGIYLNWPTEDPFEVKQ